MYGDLHTFRFVERAHLLPSIVPKQQSVLQYFTSPSLEKLKRDGESWQHFESEQIPNVFSPTVNSTVWQARFQKKMEM